MIGKSIALTVLLLVFYVVLFEVFPVRTVQDLFHVNISKGQQYVFEKELPNRLVLIGSSLSGGVIADSIPGLQSLALGGLSVFDGLTLVSSNYQLPDTLLVEINVLEKTENINYTDYFTNPVLSEIYRNFPALRADARPVGYAIKLINYPINFVKRRFAIDLVNIDQTVVCEDSLNRFQKLLQNQITEYSDLSDTVQILENISILSSNLLSLKHKGVKIILIELPVDTALRKLPRPTYIRNAFSKEFVNMGYVFIPSPREQFLTIDGIHLTYNEAVRYTEYLERILYGAN